MIKKHLLLVAFVCVWGWQAKAQQTDENKREITRYKWEVATDLLWLIDKNVVPPSVFVRLNREKKGRLGAYRFRLGGDLSEHLNPFKVDTGWAGSTLMKTKWTTFVSIGKEWQKQFNQFQFFYGSDIFMQYSLDVYANAILYGKKYYPKYRYLTTGISPFIGLKFFIHSRISVSTEAHANISYYSLAWHNFDNTANPPAATKLTANYFQVRFNLPLYVINLSYHF